MTEAIGFDIGGVLAAEVTIRDYKTVEEFVNIPEIDRAFDAVRQLVDERFGENAYVISKVSERVETISRAWMAHHNFVERTGIGQERLIYCRAAADKAPIAGRLGLTHFVDNSLAVMSHFNGGERLFLFQPKPRQLEAYAEHLGKVTVVQTWPEILAAI